MTTHHHAVDAIRGLPHGEARKSDRVKALIKPIKNWCLAICLPLPHGLHHHRRDGVWPPPHRRRAGECQKAMAARLNGTLGLGQVAAPLPAAVTASLAPTPQVEITAALAAMNPVLKCPRRFLPRGSQTGNTTYLRGQLVRHENKGFSSVQKGKLWSGVECLGGRICHTCGRISRRQRKTDEVFRVILSQHWAKHQAGARRSSQPSARSFSPNRQGFPT